MSAGSSSYSNQRSVACDAVLNIASTTPQYTFPFGQEFQISEVWVVITTAVTVADSVITVKRNKVPRTTTGDVSIGTFVVPFTDSTIGDVIRADFRTLGDTLLCPGETISFLSSNASSAGGGWFGVIGYEARQGNDPYPFVSFDNVTKDRSGTGKIKYAAVTEV